MPPIALHSIFEVLTNSVGFQLFLRERGRLALPALTIRIAALLSASAQIIGAAFGAKLAFWIDDLLAAFAHFPDWRHLLEAKSIDRRSNLEYSMRLAIQPGGCCKSSCGCHC